MNRSIVIAGVLLCALSACGSPSLPTGRPTISAPTEVSAPPPTKYIAVPSCAQLGERVPGLPKFRVGNEKPSPFEDLFTGCEFRRTGQWPLVRLDISGWLADPRRAEESFQRFSDPVDDGPADEVEVGQKARWLTPKGGDSCYLKILDDNAVLLLQHQPELQADPRSEACRGRLRELATAFYAAVQPR